LYSDVISTTAASAQSSVIPPYVRHAMLTSTTACFVAYGSDPTAAAGAGSFYLPGGETIHLTVTPGQKFAAIRAVDNGRLSIVGVSGGQALTYTSESSWTPADLFASGEQGGWYDPSDLSTMFQNDNGTGAVAVNDTVGYIADKSGRGNHLTQANSARRPVLRQDAGGKYYLEFDGADDSFATSGTVNFSATDKASVVAGVALGDSGATGIIWEHGNNSAPGMWLATRLQNARDLGWRLAGNTSGLYRTTSGGLTGVHITSVNFDIAQAALASEITPRINGAIPALTVGQAGPAGTGNHGNQQMFVGRRGGTALPYAGALYGLIARAALTQGESLDSAEAWMAEKTGVTL
jgi:hypothetical protein